MAPEGVSGVGKKIGTSIKITKQQKSVEKNLEDILQPEEPSTKAGKCPRVEIHCLP